MLLAFFRTFIFVRKGFVVVCVVQNANIGLKHKIITMKNDNSNLFSSYLVGLLLLLDRFYKCHIFVFVDSYLAYNLFSSILKIDDPIEVAEFKRIFALAERNSVFFEFILQNDAVSTIFYDKFKAFVDSLVVEEIVFGETDFNFN